MDENRVRIEEKSKKSKKWTVTFWSKISIFRGIARELSERELHENGVRYEEKWKKSKKGTVTFWSKISILRGIPRELSENWMRIEWELMKNEKNPNREPWPSVQNYWFSEELLENWVRIAWESSEIWRKMKKIQKGNRDLLVRNIDFQRNC